MTEDELIQRWQQDEPMYKAWGEYVRTRILDELTEMLGQDEAKLFIKIPPVPRTKELKSLIDKAFYRPSKSYKNPYDEIEDKVGVRFVVLLTSGVNVLQTVIENVSDWTHSLDRDYEQEREARPHEFAYQSKHYVIRSANPVESSGLIVPANVSCEIQLRTLLQHAHSELTHDKIYKRKSNIPVGSAVQRAVAKSMALIEAVDDYFIQATKQLDEATDAEHRVLTDLATAYKTMIGLAPETDKSATEFLDTYRDQVQQAPVLDRLEKFVKENGYVPDRIRARRARQHMFRQSWVLMLYALVKAYPSTTASRWPFTPDELRPIYNDLGIRFPN